MKGAALLAIAVLCASVDQRWALDSFNGRVAVVTGASSGIGRSIAIELVKRGMLVVGIARGVEPMQNLSESLADQPGKLISRGCDVRVEADVVSTFQWIADNLGAVATLVNCAGISIAGELIDGNTSYWRDTLDTNVLGLSICTREAIRNMIRNEVGDGQIIHISSDLGFYNPMTLGSQMYSASKHAVACLCEGLRRELYGRNSTLRVTCLYPGTTNTPLLRGPDYYALGTIESRPMLQPENLAQAAIYILSTPRAVQVVHLLIEPVGAPVF